ncbi:CPXCG motif-containing cysteine-rich protein [Lysobacter sp.]|uniref:CPXCG motif-containing cysteine-rich protein n=1 Tax=Lysobacter sp. TaxID=72226 RepID=UPI002D580BBF|nr:CPXCG motif-containing cysteine-rich protein [Lysobacter sp.]HZX77108.1 CPXCG motif-containing cysteine-rich protein [Lysobacter sp.]
MLSNVDVRCPYCGEWISLVVDESAGSQRYIEDCQVCCQPMVVAVEVDEDGSASVQVEREGG